MNYFAIKTAWRDARSQLGSLLLYCSGIIAGVAALVAILSFRADVLLTVDEQAKELLGADLEILQNEDFSSQHIAMFDTLGGRQASSVEFSSMVVYGETGETRLSQIRGISGGFPFYGEIKTEPASAAASFQDTGTALVDRPVMRQLGLAVGDSIRVGNTSLMISGKILEVPGESAAFSLIGPRVIVPKETIEQSGLLQRGSRVQHKQFFAFDEARDVDALVASVRKAEGTSQLRFTTVESRKNDFSEIVDNLTRFLGMIGFIALLLGALGVASAVYVYIKRKSATVATLRCLGVSSGQTLTVFAIQVVAMGLTGAFAGAVLGVLIQQFLPMLFMEFLPFEIVQQLSWSSVLLGLGIGVLVSLVFAVLPLISVNTIPPLLAIRTADFSPLAHLKKSTFLWVMVMALMVVTAVLSVLTDSLIAALAFMGGLIISVLLLLGVSKLLVSGLKKLRLPGFSYIWRQGVANLFRPNNQTAVLVTTLGMGMLLIGVMSISRDMILDRIAFQTGDDQPNLVFYDIQVDQNDDIIRLAKENNARVLQNVPIVSMRLSEFKGRTIQEIRDDENNTISGWALRREYRVTYRSELNEAETITQGEWIGEADGFDSVVPISVGQQIIDELGASLGDHLVFDVQGIPIETKIASVREIDFQRPEPNFFVLFPAGVLEPAPQFFATVINVPGGADEVAAMQQAIVRAHPNVSALDIGLVLESVRTFLEKIELAVQFMALFSVLTGLIVLGSAIAISRFQRIKEAVLLRTLGAVQQQVSRIQLIEYALLGVLASLAGLGLSLIAGWFIAWFWFDLAYVPNFVSLGITTTAIVLLVLLVGAFNMRRISGRKPLEILRASVN
ncbi:MAG: ABC transporter permease [Balneolales bacterium]|nr:ABC transporter permease [Balneolales bacterium]